MLRFGEFRTKAGRLSPYFFNSARFDDGATLLRLEEQPAQRGVSIAPLSRALLFDAHKGTVTPTATLQVQAADGRAIHQVVNIMGRVRSCSPAGQLNGLPQCS